jgi:hypothetical protein
MTEASRTPEFVIVIPAAVNIDSTSDTAASESAALGFTNKNALCVAMMQSLSFFSGRSFPATRC